MRSSSEDDTGLERRVKSTAKWRGFTFRTFILGLAFVVTGHGMAQVAPVPSVESHGPEPLTTVIKRVLPGVVKIEVQMASGGASGTGFILSSNGVIASAAHLFSGANSARITLANGDIYDTVTVLETDARKDIVLLKVKGFGLPTLTLRDSNAVEVGERLGVVGNPAPGAKSLDWTTTDGLLSAIRHDEGRTLFQVSVPLTHGSSGSPVFDQTGAVVGMVVAGYPGEDFNFAIPTNYLAGLLDEVKELSPDALSSHGKKLETATFGAGAAASASVEFPDQLAFELVGIKTVAVIPFALDGVSDDYMTDYFSELYRQNHQDVGVADAVELALHYEGGGAFRPDAPLKSLLAAARAVQSQAIILGSGSRYSVGGFPGVTLQVKMIEVNKGKVLWSVSGQSTGGGFSQAQAKKMAVRSVSRKIP